MRKVQSHITVQNKRHAYSLEEKKSGVVRVVCADAHIDQDFLVEDVPALLMDLPNLIVAEREHQKQQSQVVRFRVSSKDKRHIEQKAVRAGYSSVSSYIRDTMLAC